MTTDERGRRKPAPDNNINPAGDDTASAVAGPGNLGTTPDRAYAYAEVVHLLALAYVTGRTHADADLAETQHHWAVHASPRRTYEQRVADRVAEMTQNATDLALRRFETGGNGPWIYLGGEVDWDTGRPMMNGVAA